LAFEEWWPAELLLRRRKSLRRSSWPERELGPIGCDLTRRSFFDKAHAFLRTLRNVLLAAAALRNTLVQLIPGFVLMLLRLGPHNLLSFGT
jgi:hypothetical protein